MPSMNSTHVDSIVVVVDCFSIHTILNFNSAHNLQTDGKTEVVNRTIGNMIRNLIHDHSKQEDLVLPQDGFAFNIMENCSTKHFPFFVVYGKVPNYTLDLIRLPRVTKELHTTFAISSIQHCWKSSKIWSMLMHATKRLLTKTCAIRSLKLVIWSWLISRNNVP